MARIGIARRDDAGGRGKDKDKEGTKCERGRGREDGGWTRGGEGGGGDTAWMEAVGGWKKGTQRREGGGGAGNANGARTKGGEGRKAGEEEVEEKRGSGLGWQGVMGG